MRQSVDQKLNDIFDVEHRIIDQSPVTVDVKPALPTPSEVEDDYEYARKNLRSLIDNGKDVMENLSFLAKEGESPRAYEVIGQMIKTLADTNKDLLNLAKAKKEIQQEVKKDNGVSPTHVTNALFVGSTAELQQLIAAKK
jgi:hypothetical protein